VTLAPAPVLGDYPSTDAVTQTPTDYVGSQVSLEERSSTPIQ
jgi:hypothetical protein